MRFHDLDDVTEIVEISVFLSLGLLVLLNSIFVGYGVIINRREGKRAKAIKAAKVAYEEAIQANEAKEMLKKLYESRKLLEKKPSSLSVVQEENKDLEED